MSPNLYLSRTVALGQLRQGDVATIVDHHPVNVGEDSHGRSIVPTIQSRSQSVPERESHFSHETDRTNNRISVVRDDRIYTNLQ